MTTTMNKELTALKELIGGTIGLDAPNFFGEARVIYAHAASAEDVRSFNSRGLNLRCIAGLAIGSDSFEAFICGEYFKDETPSFLIKGLDPLSLGEGTVYPFVV